MQKAIFFFSLMICFNASCVQAQKAKTTQESNINIEKEKQLITQTIEIYFDGWKTGDTTKLGRAMHRTCQLKNIKDDDVIIFDRATYLGFFKLRPEGRPGSSTRIIDIDVTRDVASAKCEIETVERLYTDYFNMMKVGGQWYIVDKAATNVLKEKK